MAPKQVRAIRLEKNIEPDLGWALHSPRPAESFKSISAMSELWKKLSGILARGDKESAAFRDNCNASYGLDPAFYYTLPGFMDYHVKAYRCKI